MTDRLTPEEIESARKLCADATPGPWEIGHPGRVGGIDSAIDPHGDWVIEPFDDEDAEQRAQPKEADWRFIAASRTLLPRALTEIESLRAQAERDRAVIEAARTHDHINLIGDDQPCGLCAALTALDGGEGEKAR